VPQAVFLVYVSRVFLSIGTANSPSVPTADETLFQAWYSVVLVFKMSFEEGARKLE